MGDITMMMKDIHKNALVLFPIELLQVAKEMYFLPNRFYLTLLPQLSLDFATTILLALNAMMLY
jgi:hypothetical protein